MPVAYGLFAFAVATAAGAVLRRSLPALAIAFAAFIAVRVGVAGWVRPAFQAPLTLTEGVVAGDPAVEVGRPPIETGDALDWVLATGYAEQDGRQLSYIEVYDLSLAARKVGVDLGSYLQERGVRQWVDYHPAQRFWTFQLIEAGLFAALAAAFIAVVVSASQTPNALRPAAVGPPPRAGGGPATSAQRGRLAQQHRPLADVAAQPGGELQLGPRLGGPAEPGEQLAAHARQQVRPGQAVGDDQLVHHGQRLAAARSPSRRRRPG